jgi:DNA transformation protein
MGEKNAKLAQQSSEACERVVKALASLGDLSSKKMFGGYGIFESGVMFALVNSQGEVYFKADETNRARFQEIDANQHGRMPYFQIPDKILEDQPALLEWARSSLVVAHSKAKK